ncbi:hypothetical protein B0H15DRAFT_143680 [Mycena belliarum]|uniref:Uncharacterized protein n=1 Tax=Mycena belliarum TaxID=1033014 RepID=A0AAD6U8T8_9AGAR|nr:hypothetical protein B0H15DRAFT_143680 [Mycena belliae]
MDAVIQSLLIFSPSSRLNFSSTPSGMSCALKFCAALLLVASVAVAIEIEAPVNAASSSPIVIKWTPDPSLDVKEFSIELVHPEFNEAFAIANSVNPTAGTVEVNLPAVPAAGGYTIEFVNVSDINDVLGSSPEFSIAPPASTSESASSSATRASGTLSGASATATAPMSGSTSMSMSGVTASAASSAAASARSSAASASASPSSAAARTSVRGTSAALVCTGVVSIGLLSASWIL